MKRFARILIFVLLSTLSYSQSFFPVSQVSTFDEIFVDLIQYDDSILYLFGTQVKDLYGNKKFRNFVKVIDLQGKILSSCFITNFNENIYLTKYKKDTGGFFAFGVRYLGNESENIVIKYDRNFNIKAKKSFLKDSLTGLYAVQDVLEFDSIFILINYNLHKLQSFPSFSILKINNDFDSLGSFFSYPYTGIAYSGLMNKNNGDFRVFTYAYYGLGWGQSVLFDKNLYVKRVDSLPRLLHGFNDAIWITDSTYLISGKLSGNMNSPNQPFDWDLGIEELDTNTNLLRYKYQSRVGVEGEPGWGRNISKVAKNEYYYCGTINRVVYPVDTSYVVLTKIDSCFNILWEVIIGDSVNSYDVFGLYTLLDGSALLLIGRFENHTNEYLDAYAYKISKNGIILSTTKIFNHREIIIYPNPATSTINISLEAQGESIAVLRIYDNAGRTLYFSKPGKAKAAINIKSYATGVYFLEGRTAKGETFVRKFVKE